MSVYLVPPDLPTELIEQLKRPEGGMTFTYRSPQLFDRTAGPGVLFQVPTGAMLFRLERSAELELRFIHAAPGTGTRIATVDLRPLEERSAIWVALTWSPEETRLYVGDADRRGEALLTGLGQPSVQSWQIGADGGIYRVGDEGVQVIGARVFNAGTPTLEPSALDAWRDTVEAVKVLLAASSEGGHLFDVVRTNLIIAVLVTGYEAYCETRFQELDREGVPADFERLASKFPALVRRLGGRDAIVREAAIAGAPPSRQLVGFNGINFQSYDDSKKAYNAGYGLKFGEDLGVPSQLLETVQSLIRFRHRIIHVSALIGVLNQPAAPPEEPIFSTREYADTALDTFTQFVEGLHSATLRLRPR